MKAFQTYIAELNTPYKFRVKLAGINPTGDVFDKIKHPLDAYQVESISQPKSTPVKLHSEFPKMGPCECYMMEVVVKYPTTADQLRQVIGTRGQIDPACICVYSEDAGANEDAVQERINAQGAVLTEPEMKTEPAPMAGQQLVDSFLKELSTRKYEIAGTDKTDGKNVVTNGKTTNDTPQNTKSVLNPNTTPRGK